MKRFYLIAGLCMFQPAVFGQAQTDLDAFNKERNRITRNSMIVLGGWSVANLVYSGIATGGADGSQKYFHQMNVMWGGINLGLATIGYIGSRKSKHAGLTNTVKQQSGIEKTYFLNLGLDVAYVAGGFYLKERAKRSTADAHKMKGYGQSVILQGGALFVLDAVLFYVHNRHGRQLNALLDKIQLGTTGNGIGILYKL